MRKLFLSLMVCFLAVGVSFAAEADFSVFRKIYNPQLPELQLPERVKAIRQMKVNSRTDK